MVDRVTVEVVRHAAIAAAEEMGVVLRNASMSPNIRDRLDFSCAVLSPEGELVAQAEHIPVHLGSMPVGARAVLGELERLGVEPGPGDVVVSNDPYLTGTHINDVMMLAPVHAGGRLAAYVACKAHYVDVGGCVPGGIGPGARSLRDEGLVVPPVKLVEAGRVRWDVLRLLEANVREPGRVRGDAMAQLAALRRGAERIRELAGRYGTGTLLEAWREILDYTERYTRSVLARLVEEHGGGVYEAEDGLETASGRLLRIRARLEVTRSRVRVDFSGTSPQVEEPLNAVYGVTVAATTYALKTVLDPDMPMNSGFYRVAEIHAPEGTLVNPRPPAPVGGGNVETSQRIADVVLRALAEAFPGRVPAASCGTMSNLILAGRGWVFYETIGCGAGARPCCDGVDGVQTNMTNTLNTPVEVAEAEYPLRFRRYELRPGSGGPGRWRGGLGVVRAVTVLEDGVVATVYAERSRTRPWGLEGGGPGAPFRALLVRGSGERLELASKTTLVLSRGDTIYIETPGGGGYGDPCARPRELVERDLAEGRISLEEARKHYCYEDQGGGGS